MVIFREPWAHSQEFGQQVNTTVEDKLTPVIGMAEELHVATLVSGLEDPKVQRNCRQYPWEELHSIAHECRFGWGCV